MIIKVVCTDRGQHPKRQLGFTGSAELGAKPLGPPQVVRRPDGSGSTNRWRESDVRPGSAVPRRGMAPDR